jgi:DNA replication protein DnaC
LAALRPFEPTEQDLADNQKAREKYGYAPNPFCKACRGLGAVYPLNFEGKPDYRKTVDCKAKDCLADSKQVYMKTNQYLVIHGVTERLQTFDRFKRSAGTAASYKAFYRLAHGETDKPFILCYGDTGRGKTHLCQALTTVLNQRGIGAYYYQVPDLLDVLRRAIDSNSVEEWVQALRRMEALALDDLGSGINSDWALEKLQEIIDARWTAKRITVVTMNKTLGELTQLSPRIFSRMCDQELSVVVRCEGIDYRTGKM